ncbi:MAG: DUF3943 domain-containing protein [Bacteriovorax sp.]|nr:DUF3943 domain-containing protein [Bacteriovorax sp.]
MYLFSVVGVFIKIFITLLLLLIGTSTYATDVHDSDLGRRVLISVGDFGNSNNQAWKKEICNRVFTLANKVSGNYVDVTCREFDTSRFVDSSLESLRSEYDYHLKILKNKDGSLEVGVNNWKRIHETDFTSLGWTIKDGEKTKISKEEAFAKAIGNFFFYVSNQTAFKAGLLVNGVQESKKIKYDQKHGLFKDTATEVPISINQAYSIFEGESDRKKNYLRTGIELGVLFSAAMAVYYQNLPYNSVDFDYTLKDGLKKKLNGQAILFDDNDKVANYGHTYAGVLYFQMARTNGFNSLESFLIAFASSTTWEFLEYHEVLSINDEILTSVGGYVIGEASYQIACALLQKNTAVAKALAYTINPGLGTNHAIDAIKKGNKFASQPDCKKSRWSEISTYIGLDRGQKAYSPNPKNNLLIGMDATVVNIDNYGKPGTESKLVYDTAMAKALIEANGNDGLIDLKVVAQVMSAAYHQKNIKHDVSGDLRGYDILLGVGSMSTWNDRGTNKKGGKEDFYGTVNILGATAHADIYYKGFNIRADVGFYGDFAMVKSYALSDYKDSRGGTLEGESTVIKRRGYYWGYGTTTLAAISIGKGRFEVGYKGQFSSANSINNRDRVQSDVTFDTHFSDQIQSNRLYVSYRVTNNLKLELSQEFNFRSGSVNDNLEEEGSEDRTMGILSYQF